MVYGTFHGYVPMMLDTYVRAHLILSLLIIHLSGLDLKINKQKYKFGRTKEKEPTKMQQQANRSEGVRTKVGERKLKNGIRLKRKYLGKVCRVFGGNKTVREGLENVFGRNRMEREGLENVFGIFVRNRSEKEALENVFGRNRTKREGLENVFERSTMGKVGLEDICGSNRAWSKT